MVHGVRILSRGLIFHQTYSNDAAHISFTLHLKFAKACLISSKRYSFSVPTLRKSVGKHWSFSCSFYSNRLCLTTFGITLISQWTEKGWNSEISAKKSTAPLPNKWIKLRYVCNWEVFRHNDQPKMEGKSRGSQIKRFKWAKWRILAKSTRERYKTAREKRFGWLARVGDVCVCVCVECTWTASKLKRWKSFCVNFQPNVCMWREYAA